MCTVTYFGLDLFKRICAFSSFSVELSDSEADDSSSSGLSSWSLLNVLSSSRSANGGESGVSYTDEAKKRTITTTTHHTQQFIVDYTSDGANNAELTREKIWLYRLFFFTYLTVITIRIHAVFITLFWHWFIHWNTVCWWLWIRTSAIASFGNSIGYVFYFIICIAFLCCTIHIAHIWIDCVCFIGAVCHICVTFYLTWLWKWKFYVVTPPTKKKKEMIYSCVKFIFRKIKIVTKTKMKKKNSNSLWSGWCIWVQFTSLWRCWQWCSRLTIVCILCYFIWAIRVIVFIRFHFVCVYMIVFGNRSSFKYVLIYHNFSSVQNRK